MQSIQIQDAEPGSWLRPLPLRVEGPAGSQDRSFRTTAIRRVINYTGLFVFSAVYILILPLLLLVVGPIEDLVNWRRAPVFRCLIFLAAYRALQMIGIVGGALLWARGRWWPGLDRRRHLRLVWTFHAWWVETVIRVACRLFRIQVEVSGLDDELGDRPLLVFMRREGKLDAFLPAYLLTRTRGILLRPVFHREFLEDLVLDLIAHQIPAYFVDTENEDSRREVEAIGSLACPLAAGEGVVLFPEGSRFSRKRRRRVLQHLWKQGNRNRYRRAERLRHVLPPKLGAALALMRECPEADVLFATHAGLDGVFDPWALLKGDLYGRVVSVRFWRVPGTRIPRGNKKQSDWMFDQWEAVNDFVGEQMGEAPVLKPQPARSV